MFDRAMREDKDGAVYFLYPGGLPVVEFPYSEGPTLRASIKVAQALTKLGLSGEGGLIRPVHIGMAVGAAAVFVLWFMQLVLCWVLF